nr:HAMP domain-containing sensor histidine kinase [Neptunicella marina]
MQRSAFHLDAVPVCLQAKGQLDKSMQLRLGSLRQLTLVSFMFALLPLGVLLWQNQRMLSDLGNLAVTQARHAVDLTRSVESLQDNANDIERLVRQYRVLNNPDLLPVIQNYTRLFSGALTNSCNKTDLSHLCVEIRHHLQQIVNLDAELDTQSVDLELRQFRQLLVNFTDAASAQLDASLDQQRQHVLQTREEITWQTLILVIITMMLVWAASQVVVKPVSKLERLIRAIGNQNANLPAMEFNYPRELVDLDTRLRWLAKRLTHLESIRHAMLRHASHELKTPLASIREGCSLLSDEVVGPLSEKQQEVVSLLDIGAKRLTQLVEQLLDYNRLLQQSNAKPGWINVADLFEQISERHKLSVAQNKQYLQLDLQIKRLFADEQLLQRILDNLINNAVAYGLADSAIDIELTQQDSHYCLTVSNACRTWDTDSAEQLFQPFQRGEHSQRNDGLSGSGLGLSIVADCARMMGGGAHIVPGDPRQFSVRILLPNNKGTE